MSNRRHGRLQFNAIEMLRQAIGLPTPGYAVITKDFGEALVDELQRLYGLEESLAAVGDAVSWDEFKQLKEEEQRHLFVSLNHQARQLDGILAEIPPCPTHGDSCTEYALSWVKAQSKAA
ncbi:MAG: hypothetical protein KC441_12850 [Anaerolineales bacterium]|nr:hypothetical protein [Anaerolineales bacterium]